MITSAGEVGELVFDPVCLFMCVSVSRITAKVIGQFHRNLVLRFINN